MASSPESPKPSSWATNWLSYAERHNEFPDDKLRNLTPGQLKQLSAALRRAIADLDDTQIEAQANMMSCQRLLLAAMSGASLARPAVASFHNHIQRVLQSESNAVGVVASLPKLSPDELRRFLADVAREIDKWRSMGLFGEDEVRTLESLMAAIQTEIQKQEAPKVVPPVTVAKITHEVSSKQKKLLQALEAKTNVDNAALSQFVDDLFCAEAARPTVDVLQDVSTFDPNVIRELNGPSATYLLRLIPERAIELIRVEENGPSPSDERIGQIRNFAKRLVLAVQEARRKPGLKAAAASLFKGFTSRKKVEEPPAKEEQKVDLSPTIGGYPTVDELVAAVRSGSSTVVAYCDLGVLGRVVGEQNSLFLRALPASNRKGVRIGSCHFVCTNGEIDFEIFVPAANPHDENMIYLK